MTEDEAKTKNCCGVQGSNQNVAFKCEGSICMAWRWLPLMVNDAYKAAIIKAAADIGDETSSKHKAAAHVNANRAQYGLPTQPFDGYCGLAGKP